MGNDVQHARRVVVTGAGSGIGKGVALLLLEQGAQVVAADIDESSLREVGDAGAETITCDVTSAADRDRLLRVAGDIDGLVNAAGIIRLLPVSEVTEEDWDAILDVNVKALFFLARDLGARMPVGAGIVNLASVAGKSSGTTEALVYGTSKAAVLAITRSLAYWFGPAGVRVNAVLPGITDTPMQDKVLREIATLRGTTPEALHRTRLAGVPLQQRGCEPREMAEVISFLLSSAASYMTGQALAVDGGLVMF
jgi:NAD(P)-dependent dehydrogenase (short-subunit alcohol dehydrogenase family)